MKPHQISRTSRGDLAQISRKSHANLTKSHESSFFLEKSQPLSLNLKQTATISRRRDAEPRPQPRIAGTGACGTCGVFFLLFWCSLHMFSGDFTFYSELTHYVNGASVSSEIFDQRRLSRNEGGSLWTSLWTCPGSRRCELRKGAQKASAQMAAVPRQAVHLHDPRPSEL